MYKKTIIVSLLLFLGIVSCKKSEPFPHNKMDLRLTGGMNYTIFNASSEALTLMIPNLSSRDAFVHEVGDKVFESKFVSAPALVNPGLGPIFNNTACENCHQNEGRGRPPVLGGEPQTMLMRISVPGKDVHGGPLPVPGFGEQLQDKAVAGYKSEANVKISYTDKKVTLNDGTVIDLRVPHYQLTNPYRPLPGNLLLSPRVAAPLVGTGLINAIPESQILKNADPEDKDGNGISGRANLVYDHTSKSMRIGRFGWKANVGSLSDQVASALHQDMGITNAVFPSESSKGQSQFPKQNTKGVNLSDSLLHSIIFYMKTLAVPARRNVNSPLTNAGAAIFEQIGCESCHISTFTTKVNVAFRPLSNQVIHPYSDFLLHDMGPGLADDRPDYKATGKEWRTTPLWAIGLTEKVSGFTLYLHDGRARTLTEAILWHGGEAAQSRDSFKKLGAADRKAVLAFLKSL